MSLKGRIATHINSLNFEELVKQSTSTSTLTSLMSGYYGPRGDAIVVKELLALLGNKVQQLRPDIPVRTFVQTVLVTELSVRLVIEDMGINDDQTARSVLMSSAEAGGECHGDQTARSVLSPAEDDDEIL